MTVKLVFEILFLVDSPCLLVFSLLPFLKLCMVPQVAWVLLVGLVGTFASVPSWTEVQLTTLSVFSPHLGLIDFCPLNSSSRVTVLWLLQMICVLYKGTCYVQIQT